MSHYDNVVAPAITASEHHVGQQMIEVGDMSGKFGMDLSLIDEGEVSRQIG